MALNFGYSGGDESFTGGKMKSDINMNYWALKNIAAPTDNADAISKQVLENYLLKYYEKTRYETIFDINIGRAVKNNGIVKHPFPYDLTVRNISRVKDGRYYLHASKNILKSPTVQKGESFISSDLCNTTPTPLTFTCPRFSQSDISVFVVLTRKIWSTGSTWEYIVGNDDGSYDKYIGYSGGSLTTLSYGGGFPIKEYTCTIPNDSTGNPIDTTQKHLISCHWLVSGSHVRVNNIISTDSSFTSNLKHIGAPFATIFANCRSSGTPDYLLKAKLYGLKVVSGFLEPADIDTISQEMMAEYRI